MRWSGSESWIRGTVRAAWRRLVSGLSFCGPAAARVRLRRHAGRRSVAGRLAPCVLFRLHLAAPEKQDSGSTPGMPAILLQLVGNEVGDLEAESLSRLESGQLLSSLAGSSRMGAVVAARISEMNGGMRHHLIVIYPG